MQMKYSPGSVAHAFQELEECLERLNDVEYAEALILLGHTLENDIIPAFEYMAELVKPRVESDKNCDV